MKKIYDNLTASDVARIPASDLSFAIIKESYPLEEKKKLVVCYTLSKVLWRGDEYDYAESNVSWCCDEAAKRIVFQSSSIPSSAFDQDNFKRMVYQGKAVDSCPFCGAEIAIEGK